MSWPCFFLLQLTSKLKEEGEDEGWRLKNDGRWRNWTFSLDFDFKLRTKLGFLSFISPKQFLFQFLFVLLFYYIFLSGGSNLVYHKKNDVFNDGTIQQYNIGSTLFYFQFLTRKGKERNYYWKIRIHIINEPPHHLKRRD